MGTQREGADSSCSRIRREASSVEPSSTRMISAGGVVWVHRDCTASRIMEPWLKLVTTACTSAAARGFLWNGFMIASPFLNGLFCRSLFILPSSDNKQDRSRDSAQQAAEACGLIRLPDAQNADNDFYHIEQDGIIPAVPCERPDILLKRCPAGWHLPEWAFRTAHPKSPFQRWSFRFRKFL